MSRFLNQSKFYNQPVLLSEEEKENPLMVLNDFLSSHHLSELRDFIWQMVNVCLTTDNSEFAEPRERAYLTLVGEDLEKAMEAIYVLNEKEEQKGK